MGTDHHQQDARLSRRQLAKAAAVAAGGVLVGATAEAQPARPAATDPLDPRLAEIEKSRGRPLSAEQRQAVADGIRSTIEAWEKGRAFLVPDGAEPALVFRPALPSARAPRR